MKTSDPAPHSPNFSSISTLGCLTHDYKFHVHLADIQNGPAVPGHEAETETLPSCHRSQHFRIVRSVYTCEPNCSRIAPEPFEEIVFMTKQGKGANPPRPINHRLSVASGGGAFFGIRLGLQI
ncbi:hypothetical protein AVEN_269811-1 [Araneus ventricosus]|uniref:Uncharacterized protein n=1 Tax=Araneus ventricosus TaxID=182803 RepID=A0A4Y2JIZ3_ARAVE|nr:hypothetical protein AVEN_269811-1 [Araneus ventricosus]